MRGDRSGFNIAAFVLGILTFLPFFGFLTGLIGLICAAIGLTGGTRYRLFAWIGVVLIVIAVILNLTAYGVGGD